MSDTTPAVPERWRGICALLQEKNWPVFHNSVDVETILVLAQEVGAAEAKITALESQNAEPWKHSDHWRNPETGQVECECCCSWALDMGRFQAKLTALEAESDEARADKEHYSCKANAAQAKVEQLTRFIQELRDTTFNQNLQLRCDAAINQNPKPKP